MTNYLFFFDLGHITCLREQRSIVGKDNGFEGLGFAVAAFTAVDDDDLQHVSHLLSGLNKKPVSSSGLSRRRVDKERARSYGFRS